MKATETFLILCQMDAGEITLQEAHELILRLFGVSNNEKTQEKCQYPFNCDFKKGIVCTKKYYCEFKV